jgi:hypothetical protein
MDPVLAFDHPDLKETHMEGTANFKPNNNNDDMSEAIATAMEHAKAKHERLRHLKERNENYLAERRDNEEPDEDRTREL